ncbi:PREDICTED: zinc metalloproteinase nas-4-like [Drosophila arizonae]|uniref:Metalloendopeptidase n=1 Tax=Drosophila arizonae TaxID=7263 RepID=A0ABM1NZ95_DROAR|nr:PREDICTED: zinc metalloproteinase nas-4-like [Drosophila arizonae]
MSRFLIIVCLILLLSLDISAAPAPALAPVPAARTEVDPELTAGFSEGDMIISAEQRNGLRSDNYRWPNRTVYYYINSNIDQPHREQILVGLRKIEASSCLTFQEVAKDQKYYVNITSEPGGCFTAVGFQNHVQQMNLQNYPLDEGCYRMGTIMHEMLHALGFYHEQSSADRDEYVRIAYENIEKGKEQNFDKFDNDKVDNFDQEYDYGSVLHYSPYGFSKNGEMTIVPFKEGAEKQMGQRLQMSQRDINKLNIMYKCPQQV